MSATANDKGNGAAGPAEPADKAEAEISVEAALGVLERQAAERKAACKRELDAVLEKHGFGLAVAMVVTPRGNKAIIQLEAKPGG